MITEQIILSIYAVLLLEVGLLLLILILIVVHIKNTIDSIRKVIDKFVKLGNMTADTAENLKNQISSLSGFTSLFSSIPEIISFFQNFNNKFEKENLNKNEDDDLKNALSKVNVTNKKRRII